MSGYKSNTWQSQLLTLLFQNTNAANIGDATGLRGSSTTGSLYVALHTADPTAAGTQDSSEATYTGYARVGLARNSGAWGISGSSPTVVSPVANIDFGLCTGGSNTITFFSVGVAASGAGTEILYAGPISPTISVSSGVIPRLTTATQITED